MKYTVNEIFSSVQGEGVFVGTPMNFVRFTRCNLRCDWCDTEFSEGADIGVEEIAKTLDSNLKWVALTGGEPLLEKHLLSLINELGERGFKVLVETNGSIFDSAVFEAADYVSLDIKGPSSGNAGYSKEAFDYCMAHPEKTQVKAVIKDESDTAYLAGIYEGRKDYPCWVIQPEWDSLDKLDYLALIKQFPSARIIPQLHKFLKIK